MEQFMGTEFNVFFISFSLCICFVIIFNILTKV